MEFAEEMGEENFIFENLLVYQKSLNFVNVIYDITNKFPREERFVLTDQFRRAAISICLNIAEGSSGSKVEFKRYLKIARGSIRECATLITLSELRAYVDHRDKELLRVKCIELSKMLSGLLKSLV